MILAVAWTRAIGIVLFHDLEYVEVPDDLDLNKERLDWTAGDMKCSFAQFLIKKGHKKIEVRPVFF
jgi:hypothetical protein